MGQRTSKSKSTIHPPSSKHQPIAEVLQGITCCPNCHATKSPYPISGPITTKNINSLGDPTSVHKALEIPEILRQVYESLAQDDKKGTLTSMAQVCRAITESALDVIWRNLVGVTPLLSVLPVGHTDGAMFVVEENSNRYAWERFYSYAERVYEFTEISDVLNYQILHLLTQAAKVKEHHIFPNLQILNALQIYEFSPPILLQRLITPSLRFLQVIAPKGFSKTDEVLGKIFDILTTPSCDGSQSPQLQDLQLHATLPSSCLDQLASLRHLRILRLTDITPEDVGGVDYLRRLSTLPYLYALFLTIKDREFFRRVPQDGFPSLKHLTLQGSPPNLQSLLLALPSNRLEYIVIIDVVHNWGQLISGEMRIRLQEWCACFSALAQQAGTLTDLHVMLCRNIADLDDAKARALGLPMMSILKPLLELRKLHTVELRGFIKMPYSDVDVRDMAAVWREIKYMSLPSPFAEVVQPSLMSLRLLSRFCPSLQSLSIGVDMEARMDVEPNSDLLQQLNTLPVVTTHALTVLDLHNSDLRKEDVTRLANQLRDWFPLLRKVVASGSEVMAETLTALLQEGNSGPKTAAVGG